MENDRVIATVLGFLVAGLILGLLIYLVGIGDFFDEFARANGWLVAMVFLATLGWLFAWGLGLSVVLDALSIEISVRGAFLVMNGAMFSNNITPFGQAGGEPITALLISKLTNTEYERSLAAIVSLDSLNFIPSILLALFGLGYYATQVTFNRRLRIATLTVILLAVLIPSGGFLIWKYRTTIKQYIARFLTTMLRSIFAVLPRVEPPTRQGIISRIEHFSLAIERVGTSRQRILLVLAASTAGWGFQMTALWLAFRSIGTSIPFSILLFAIPVGALASITPLPGGIGGIEAVLVALLASVPGVGIGLETALAAVVIFRGSVYWVPVTIGGVVMSVNGIETV